MHAVHLHKLSDSESPRSAGFSIQKDENTSFVCVCHTSNSTLTNTIHRMCTDHVLAFNPTEKDVMKVFTEILEKINHDLDNLYLHHKKSDVSLFVGLLLDDHLHFSMFGKELTGMIVSAENIEDIFSDMDSGEGHFVYDSHWDLRDNETLYIFAPKVDTHMLGNECQTLLHLPIEERMRLMGERIERTNVHKDGIIASISRGSLVEPEKTKWSPKKISDKRNPIVWMEDIKKSSSENIKKIQSNFVHLGKNTQTWTMVGGLILSIIFLYLVVTSVMQSQYTIFVPQKYREMLADGRTKLTEATRMIDQPDNFGPAIKNVKEIIQTVKSAWVLKVDVQLLEDDLANLEKSINKVTTLKREEYRDIFTFPQSTPSVPFSIYAKDKKLFFLTQESIIGPYIPGETPKQYALPDGQKYKLSDMDGEGRIYFSTDKDKIYIFDKWIFNTLNIQQVGGWDKSESLSVYNSNIYLLSSDKKQIYKYRRQAENSYAGRSFVITDNAQQINPIIDMDVDGSVWLMSGLDRLSTEKILTAPRYERRPIPINSMGINTFKYLDSDITKIYAGESYQEVYMLADNKIWIFVPSSKRFTDVRNLTYAGQIEIPKVIITDIAIEQDGDVREIYFGSPGSGIFGTKITIKDNKIQVLQTK